MEEIKETRDINDYVEKTSSIEVVKEVSPVPTEEELYDKELDAIDILLNNENEDLDFKVYGGHLLLKYIGRKLNEETDERYMKTKSNLIVPVNMNKINNKLDIGKVLGVGSIYNYQKNEWIRFENFDFFKVGDVVLFERVSYTPFTETMCFVPFDSVRANFGVVTDTKQIANIMAKTIK